MSCGSRKSLIKRIDVRHGSARYGLLESLLSTVGEARRTRGGKCRRPGNATPPTTPRWRNGWIPPRRQHRCRSQARPSRHQCSPSWTMRSTTSNLRLRGAWRRAGPGAGARPRARAALDVSGYAGGWPSLDGGNARPCGETSGVRPSLYAGRRRTMPAARCSTRTAASRWCPTHASAAPRRRPRTAAW